jgi:hypothetical protein
MFSLSKTQHSLTIAWNDQQVLGYHFPEGGNRPFCHPLNLPGAPPLTMNEPGDHVHHQGLWVAWKKVNDVNFWEQPAKGADPTGFGKIVHQRIVSLNTTTDSASLASENAWIDWQGITHLIEHRKITVHAPSTDTMQISVGLTLRPNEREVVLDLRRGEPGADGRYYSGMAIRFDNIITPGNLLDADGRTEPMDIFGKQSRWCSFTSKHPADNETYGVAIIDHPDNPRYPTTWWVRNRENYCLIHPSPVYYEPFHLAHDESLTLQYRVVLYHGQPDAALFE